MHYPVYLKNQLKTIRNLFSFRPLSSDVVHVEDDFFVLELDLDDGRRLNASVEDVLK